MRTTLAVLLVITGVFAATFWTPEKQLTNNLWYSNLDANNGHRLVFDRTGVGHLVWWNQYGPDPAHFSYNVYYERYYPISGWTHDEMSLTTSGFAYTPSIALDSDRTTIHVVWSAEDPPGSGQFHVVYQKCVPTTTGNGGWVSLPQDLCKTQLDKKHEGFLAPAVACTRDGVVVCWPNYDATDGTYAVGFREFISNTWQPQQLQYTGTDTILHPSICANRNGDVFVAYEGTANGQPHHHIYVISRPHDGDGSWSREDVTPTASDSCHDPDIEVNPFTGDPHVVYAGELGSRRLIFHNSRSSGVWQSSCDTVSGRQGFCYCPSMSFGGDGSAHVVWHERHTRNESDARHYIMYNSLPLAGTWETPISLTRDDPTLPNNEMPNTTVASTGAVYVVWQRWDHNHGWQLWLRHTGFNLESPGSPNSSGPMSVSDVSIDGNLTWEASDGATSYDVTLVTLNGLPYDVQPPTFNSTTNTWSATHDPLNYGTAYHWDVTAKYADGVTTPSLNGPFYFKTIGEPFNLVSPGSQNSSGPMSVSDVPIDGNLTWKASDGATSYEVTLNDQPYPVHYTPNPTTNTWSATHDPLNYGTAYHWNVTAKYADGVTTSSLNGPFYFKTIGKPFNLQGPGRNQPDNPTPDVAIDCPLTWDASDGATSYEVTLNDQPYPVHYTPNPTTNTWSATHDPLNYGTAYHWNVTAKYDDGVTTPSLNGPFYFKTIGKPGPFDLVAPPNNAGNQPLTGDLSWTSSNGATSYDVYLYLDQPHRRPPRPVSNQTGTSYHYTWLGASTRYDWTVVAKNDADTTKPAPPVVRRFKTGPIFPPHAGFWRRDPLLPLLPVGPGDWLAFNAGDGLIYTARGNKTQDFYALSPSSDSWERLADIPVGREGRPPDQGCRGVTDGRDSIFMTTGNNTLEFWCYLISKNRWYQLADVPLGAGKVNGGTGLAYVNQAGVGYVYLLKGLGNDFYRYNTKTAVWDTSLPKAPSLTPSRNGSTLTSSQLPWQPGSWLVYDGENLLYAHQAVTNALWTFDLEKQRWSSRLTGMPLPAAGEGSAGAWLNGKLYALRGGRTNGFYQYLPRDNRWTPLRDMPRQCKLLRWFQSARGLGGDITAGGNMLFAFKGNTNELWLYVPNP